MLSPLLFIVYIRDGQTTPRLLHPTSLIRPAKYLAHFFKCHVSDCGQQCNSINCCLSRKSHHIRPSSARQTQVRPSGEKIQPPLVYMNLIDSHSRVEEGVTVGSCRISRLLFADDWVLITSSQLGLQHALDRISAACDPSRMKISTKNTEVLCLSANQRQCVLQVSEIHRRRWRNSRT